MENRRIEMSVILCKVLLKSLGRSSIRQVTDATDDIASQWQ